ncbi:MAG: hypothetical protein ABL994_15425, partial [Verrucomicrobiales bacterium]
IRQIILWAGRHKGNVLIFSIFFIVLNTALIVFILSLAHERDRAKESDATSRLTAQRLSQALKDLRGVAPLFADEAKALVAKKDLDGALSRIDSAIRQVPNEAEYHNIRGNILQTLLRWDEAVDAYEDAFERNPELASAKTNLELTKSLIAATPDDHEPTTEELKKLEESLIKQKRVAEAGVLIDRFGPERPLAVKMLREAVENDPQLRPIRDLFRGTKFRGLFQKQGDGTFSVSLRGIPPAAYEPLFRTQILSVSTVFIDHPNFSDLSVLSGLKLRSLSITGCSQVSDLGPLREMPLQVLNLNRTGVVDLSPLEGLPLVELNLDGCTKINDFTPLKECRDLEKLLLPRHAKMISFLRTLPKLKLIGNKGVMQPAADFWADHDNKKGPPKFLPIENPGRPPSGPLKAPQ